MTGVSGHRRTARRAARQHSWRTCRIDKPFLSNNLLLQRQFVRARHAVPVHVVRSWQANQPANIESKIVTIQLIPPPPLHEPAQIVRKPAIFLGPEIAKSLPATEYSFYIFLHHSKIVHAQLVSCGLRRSAKCAPYRWHPAGILRPA